MFIIKEHTEYKSRISRDTTLTFLSVRHVGGNSQFSFTTYLHASNAFIPTYTKLVSNEAELLHDCTFDNFTLSEMESELKKGQTRSLRRGPTTTYRLAFNVFVKLFSIRKLANISHLHSVPFLCHGTSTNLKIFDNDTACSRLLV